MRLSTAMELFAQSAGTQVSDSGRGDAEIKRYLRKKQDKLDRTRRKLAPWPEDKKGIEAVTKEVGHWSPAPEDVASLNRKSYKSGMKKRLTSPRFPLLAPPGAQPLTTVTGADQVGSIQAFIKEQGGKFCVFSHQTHKNFGCYPSRGGAENRLAQMKRFR